MTKHNGPRNPGRFARAEPVDVAGARHVLQRGFCRQARVMAQPFAVRHVRRVGVSGDGGADEHAVHRVTRRASPRRADRARERAAVRVSIKIITVSVCGPALPFCALSFARGAKTPNVLHCKCRPYSFPGECCESERRGCRGSPFYYNKFTLRRRAWTPSFRELKLCKVGGRRNGHTFRALK